MHHTSHASNATESELGLMLVTHISRVGPGEPRKWVSRRFCVCHRHIAIDKYHYIKAQNNFTDFLQNHTAFSSRLLIDHVLQH